MATDTPAAEEPQAGSTLWPALAGFTVALVVWVAASAGVVLWLRADTTPPDWDPSVHLTYALSYYAYLDRMPLADAWAGLGATSLYYPPLVHTIGALCLLWQDPLNPHIAGFTTADVATLANVVFLAALVFGSYSLACQLYGPAAGALAALLSAAYPVFAAQSHLYLLDMPLAAITVLTMALLVASRGLTHPLWVWPLGLCASGALWCKWSFAFILAAPLALGLIDGWRRVRRGEVTAVRFGFNLVVVLAAVLLIAGPWYLAHWRETVRELLTSNQTWLIDDDPAVLSWAGLSYYARALLADQLFVPFTLLALSGTIFAAGRRLPGTGLLGAWLVGGWLAFTLVPNKDPRFTMPLLPALAVLSTSWLAMPRWPWLKAAGWLAVAVFAVLQYGAVTFGLQGVEPHAGPRWAPWWSEWAALARHPASAAWPHEELARAIVRHTPAQGTVAVLPNTAHVNFLTVRYFVWRQLLPYLPGTDRLVQVRAALGSQGGRPVAATVDTLKTEGVDTLVTLTGNQGAHAELIDQTVRNLESDAAAFAQAFEPVAQLVMPGGERVTVHRRRTGAGGP